MQKLSTGLKIAYGFGFASRGIKDGLFQLFLFFYFSQVLGLDADLAGVSALIALVFDAISDPLVGIISDKWQSKKWGRRHPFLFVSALPLGILTFLLFSPPTGLAQSSLFLWMTGLNILVRFALTLFVVPHISLGAELTTDYKERTSVTAYRLLFAAFLSPLVMIIGYTYYFVPTETISNGLLNKEAYPKFALLCGFLMTTSILISAWTTRKIIPHLPQPAAFQQQLSTKQLLNSLWVAFSMKSFRHLVFASMFLFIGIGLGVIFSPYFGPYFFGFSALEMAVLPISSFLGAFVALFFSPYLGDKLDKKWGNITGAIIGGLFFTLPFSLSLVGLFPEKGSSLLVPIYTVFLTIAYSFLYIAFNLAPSMMADIVDEFELKSGTRQEGLFFSAMSFANKMTTGIGMFVAGLILTWIKFPKQTDVADVPQATIDWLGIIGGPVLFCIYLLSIFFLFAYPLTKERYQEIRAALDAKK